MHGDYELKPLIYEKFIKKKITGVTCGRGIIVCRALSWQQAIKWSIQLGDFLIVHFFIIPFNYFERPGCVVFMYHIFIRNQQVGCCKSAMPYDYPPCMPNSSWLFDEDHFLVYFKKYLKRQCQSFIAMWFSLKEILEVHNTKQICKIDMHSRTIGIAFVTNQ